MKKTYFGFDGGMTAAVSLALAGCSADARHPSAPSSAAAVQTDEAAQADGAAQTGQQHCGQIFPGKVL